MITDILNDTFDDVLDEEERKDPIIQIEGIIEDLRRNIDDNDEIYDKKEKILKNFHILRDILKIELDSCDADKKLNLNEKLNFIESGIKVLEIDDPDKETEQKLKSIYVLNKKFCNYDQKIKLLDDNIQKIKARRMDLFNNAGSYLS